MSRKRMREAAVSARVDGDKKAKRRYVSNMQMDDMPIDCVEQVISFLPITDVYKCKSVCMAWHVAADRVLSDWETLVMRDRDKRPVITDKNQIFVNEDGPWIERLKQLVRLKKIFFPDGYFCSKLRGVGNNIVLRNAATLTRLHMSSEPVPLDSVHPVVFNNLRDLECNSIPAHVVTALPRLPRLVKLRTRTSVEDPAETSSGDNDQFAHRRTRTRKQIT